jgi:hypothetical protein
MMMGNAYEDLPAGCKSMLRFGCCDPILTKDRCCKQQRGTKMTCKPHGRSGRTRKRLLRKKMETRAFMTPTIKVVEAAR